MGIQQNTRYMVKTLSDPGHWEKKCWITMYIQQEVPAAENYGAND